MLATGIVFLGMHLTAWVGGPSQGASSAPTTTLASTVAESTKLSVVSAAAQTVASNLGIAVVEVTKGGQRFTGNGVAVGKNGMILTPLSLVEGNSAITVDGWGQAFSAHVVGTDTESDLAVLSVDVKDLVPVTFAPASQTLDAGDWVGTEWETTSGSVLYVGGVKSVSDTPAEPGGYPILKAVTLDFVDASSPTFSLGSAAPANSLSGLPAGSVLIDAAGRVAGIVIGGDKGRVIVAPGSLDREVAADIMAYGSVENGTLGVVGVSTTASRATFEPLADPKQPRALPAGVEVESVQANSTAASAGLRRGDVIESVDGRKVTDMGSLAVDMYLASLSNVVDLKVGRRNTVTMLQADLRRAA
jgi:serine protease Do